jgi:hypothetical protein
VVDRRSAADFRPLVGIVAEDEPRFLALRELDEAPRGLERERLVPRARVEPALELCTPRDRVDGEQHGAGAVEPDEERQVPGRVTGRLQQCQAGDDLDVAVDEPVLRFRPVEV